MMNKIGFHTVFIKTAFFVPLVLLIACAALLICIITDLIADRVIGTGKISLNKRRGLISISNKEIKPSGCIKIE